MRTWTRVDRNRSSIDIVSMPPSALSLVALYKKRVFEAGQQVCPRLDGDDVSCGREVRSASCVVCSSAATESPQRHSAAPPWCPPRPSLFPFMQLPLLTLAWLSTRGTGASSRADRFHQRLAQLHQPGAGAQARREGNGSHPFQVHK